MHSFWQPQRMHTCFLPQLWRWIFTPQLAAAGRGGTCPEPNATTFLSFQGCLLAARHATGAAAMQILSAVWLMVSPEQKLATLCGTRFSRHKLWHRCTAPHIGWQMMAAIQTALCFEMILCNDVSYFGSGVW